MVFFHGRFHGGLFIGWRQANSEEGSVREKSRVVEVLLTTPGQHREEVSHLVLWKGFREVNTEDLSLRVATLAAPV